MQFKSHQLFIAAFPLQGPRALQPPVLVVVVVEGGGDGAKVVVVAGGLGVEPVVVVVVGGLGAGSPLSEIAISAQALKCSCNRSRTFFFKHTLIT